jgi:hypothetical protein
VAGTKTSIVPVFEQIEQLQVMASPSAVVTRYRTAPQ